jgi:hypothetical protein
MRRVRYGSYVFWRTAAPTNTQRDGVVVFSNENSTAKSAEYWGTSAFGPFARGSFTPLWYGTIASGTAIPRNNVGSFNRQGNIVTVSIFGDYLLNSYTVLPSGNVQIANLPYTSYSTLAQTFSVQADRVTHSLPLIGVVDASTKIVKIQEEASNLGSSNTPLDWSKVRDPYGQLSMSFSYFVT